jgi:DNA-directed RNA polymerase subunit L
MQNKNVEEVDGLHDSYNPLAVSITYDPDNRHICTVYMRQENHTMGNLLKHRLLQDPGVQYVGCGMVHPPDIRILQLKLRTDSTTPDRHLQAALRSIHAQAQQLRTAFAEAIGQGTT